MFPKQCVRWFASLVIVAATLLVDATIADASDGVNGCGCTSRQIPAASWTAAQPNSCPTQSFSMRPTPSFTSSWQRIPVTNYRTQVVNDPLTGTSATVLQPCNTYEWQPRRTPGCSLWQSFVNWWQSRCCFLHARSMPPAITNCPPASEWVVSSPEPAAVPYYAPSTSNGRLTPLPSNVSPPSAVPADRRPQLEPLPQRPNGEGSASRLSPPNTEVFVRTLDNPDSSLELGPPLVAPESGDVDAEFAADPESDPASFGLLPVSWSATAAPRESEVPTTEVWDDTGWHSEQ